MTFRISIEKMVSRGVILVHTLLHQAHPEHARVKIKILLRPSCDGSNVMKSPDVLQRLQALGMNAAPSTPAEFNKQIRQDYALWGKVVKLSGAKAD